MIMPLRFNLQDEYMPDLKRCQLYQKMGIFEVQDDEFKMKSAISERSNYYGLQEELLK